MHNINVILFHTLQTPAEFGRRYRELIKEPRYQNYTPLNFYGNAYDAMWVIAYGLHKVDMWAQNRTTDSDCESNYPGELVRLSDFNYTNQRMSCYMRKAFHAVDIVGITVSCYTVESLYSGHPWDSFKCPD